MSTLPEKVLQLSPNDRQRIEQLVDQLLQEQGGPGTPAAERTRQALEQMHQQPVQGQGLLGRIPDPVTWQRAMRRDRKLPR